MKPARDVFMLELVPIDDTVPPIIRLRRGLKALLRSHGLRCLSVDRRRAPRSPRQLRQRRKKT